MFTISEIARATGNFSPHNKIGQGYSCMVYKGTLRDGRMVAIKRSRENADEQRLSAAKFRTEVEMWSQVCLKTPQTLGLPCWSKLGSSRTWVSLFPHSDQPAVAQAHNRGCIVRKNPLILGRIPNHPFKVVIKVIGSFAEILELLSWKLMNDALL